LARRFSLKIPQLTLHNSYGLGSSLIDKEKNKDFIKSKSSLTDLMLKSSIEIYPNSKNEIFLGGELTSHLYTPVNIKSNYEIAVPGNKNRVKALEAAVFGEFNTELTPWLSLQTGLRYANFSVEDTTYKSLEPRLSFSIYPTKTTTMKFGFSKMGQFLHLLNSSSGGLPNDLWIPASRKLPFERSTQYSTGISQKIGSAWRLDLDVYRKDYTNLIDYKSGQNFIINSESNYEDLVEKNGIGESCGLEIMLDKSKGKLTGWLAYTYAFNNRKFDNINDGQWYAANYDRRHTLNVTGAYQVNSKVNLSANWVFQSGRPITVPVASHSNLSINENINYPNYIYGD
jgi:outer membrane receptor for ferrienterochelin and colicin